MVLLGGILRRGVAGGYFHWCPACEQQHPLPDSWDFDGNVGCPTFSPSFKQTFRHWTGEPGSAEARRTREDRVCHYFIKDGKI